MSFLTMKTFKFLDKNQPEPRTVRYNQETFMRDRTNNHMTASYFRMTVPRNEISDEEFLRILARERHRYVELLWNNEEIRQEIIFQDNTGFTIRTELER